MTDANKIVRVLGATACRSDFDLLSQVYLRLHQDARFDFKLLVSGAHLSDRFGCTARNIRETGLPVLAEAPSLVDTDDYTGRPLTAANLILSATPAVADFAPDVLIAVGDREDALALCMMGIYLKIPVAHFFGGDFGRVRDVDNPVRHACSKLASLHFVTLDEHRDRLIAMGEAPYRIHVVGNPALDAFRTTEMLPASAALAAVGVREAPDRPYAVMVHHPSFEDVEAGAREVDLILTELGRRGLRTCVGLPNTDAGAHRILEVYHRRKDTPGFFFYRGLDRTLFVNLLRHAALLIGNSSMGLLEAPSIPLPVINVGMRQRGRAAAKNVLFVDGESGAVCEALDTALAETFRADLRGLVNPYGDGHTVEKVVEILAGGVPRDLAFKTEDPLQLRPI